MNFGKCKPFCIVKIRLYWNSSVKIPENFMLGPRKLSVALTLRAHQFHLKLIHLLNAEMKCEEAVISRNPCEKMTCPHGHGGRHELVYYECPGIPEFCPLSIRNNSATCCPEKCGKKQYKKNKHT